VIAVEAGLIVMESRITGIPGKAAYTVILGRLLFGGLLLVGLLFASACNAIPSHVSESGSTYQWRLAANSYSHPLQRTDRTAEDRSSFVSIGTDSYGTYSMTGLTVQKSRKKTSEDGRIMIFEKACGLLSVAMIVRDCCASDWKHLCRPCSGASDGRHRSVQSATPGNVVLERIVLHGVHFQRRSDKVDNSSVAILDDAARTIKDNPGAII
jgi:hypothetical protein